MCGRFSLSSNLDRLLPRLGRRLPPDLARHHRRRPQVFPGEPVLVHRLAPGSQRLAAAHQCPLRGPWRHRRALLPADGFYKWSAHGQADGSELETTVVLTSAANGLMAPLHDRQPVIIPDGLEDPWLRPADGAALRALETLLQPWDPRGWEAVPIRAEDPRPPDADPPAAAPAVP